MDPHVLSVLVADDEPPARRRVVELLQLHADVHVVGEARSGREAVEAIERLRPDLVFLDVQMPEGDGFEVVRTVGVDRMPVVVFATAYDAYALRAFEAHALDYLLKPFDRARFDDALERARHQVWQGRARTQDTAPAPPLDSRLLALVQHLDRQAGSLERLQVRMGARIRFVEVSDVDYLEAEANYVRVHTGGTTYLLRGPLSALEAQLDPVRFVRVHRALVVNVAGVVEVEPQPGGEYLLLLRTGTRLMTGRTYRTSVQRALRLRS